MPNVRRSWKPPWPPPPMPNDAEADSLQIAGLSRLSTCDWPGKLVATVFLQGCPLACGYCHNVGILDSRVPGTVAWSEVTDLLRRRHGLLDGVVFSGGEPTRQSGLADAMRQVRALGFGVGLHTAGPYPRRFAEVVSLCDWIGLDIKAPRHRYGAVTGVESAGARAFASLRIALDAGVAMQVRTTMDPTTMTEQDMAEIAQELRVMGVTDHERQTVRAEGTAPEYAQRLRSLSVAPSPTKTQPSGNRAA